MMGAVEDARERDLWLLAIGAMMADPTLSLKAPLTWAPSWTTDPVLAMQTRDRSALVNWLATDYRLAVGDDQKVIDALFARLNGMAVKLDIADSMKKLDAGLRLNDKRAMREAFQKLKAAIEPEMPNESPTV